MARLATRHGRIPRRVHLARPVELIDELRPGAGAHQPEKIGSSGVSGAERVEGSGGFAMVRAEGGGGGRAGARRGVRGLEGGDANHQTGFRDGIVASLPGARARMARRPSRDRERTVSSSPRSPISSAPDWYPRAIAGPERAPIAAAPDVGRESSSGCPPNTTPARRRGGAGRARARGGALPLAAANRTTAWTRSSSPRRRA